MAIGDFLRALRSDGGVDKNAPTLSSDQARYLRLYALWSGNWRHGYGPADSFMHDQKLYENTRQLWRNANAVVALYAQFVYAGNTLSAGSEPLTDGTRGAIPIQAQTPDENQDKALRAAIDEWWRMTNYRQFKSMVPKFGAILGDVLVELIDDKETGTVRPDLVWPGHVVDLKLDLAGNVKAYALEYPVSEAPSKGYGGVTVGQTKGVGEGKSYLFRREVNGDGFWEYENDKLVREWENPYGFVPATWDRHEIIFGDRGMSAVERTFQLSAELNSMLSHAMDYQQKKFGAPIGVKGSALSNRNPSAIAKMLNNRNSTGDPLADAALVAQSLGLLPMSDNGAFITMEFNLGHTSELLEFMRESMNAENPEGSFSQQILEMTQVTAPGVERALGPIIGAVKDARSNYDTQTAKRIQMAISMTAQRVLAGSYGDLLTTRAKRYDLFREFGPGVYDQGGMDFIIPDREVIPDTIDERIARMLQVEQLQWDYSLRVAGIPEEELAKIMEERNAEKERQAKMEELAIVGVPEEGADDAEQE